MLKQIVWPRPKLWSGVDAKRWELVDELGWTPDEAICRAAKMVEP